METSSTEPVDEAQRLRSLDALQVLDTPSEPLFEQFTQLAAQLCGTAIALVSLVDAKRQWFKANVGLRETLETPREVSFCTHAIASAEILEVPDAQCDPRFANNPLVLGEPHLRFYAGAPLSLPSGLRVGTLCVLDRQPRRLSDAQRAQLQTLAAAVVEALLMRQRLLASQGEDQSRFRLLSEFSPVGVFHTDALGQCTYVNPRWQQIYGQTQAEALGDGWSRGLHPADREAVFAAWRQAAAGDGVAFERRFRVCRPDGSERRVHARARALRNAQGDVTGHVGAVEDISAQAQAQHEAELALLQLAFAGETAGVGAWRVELLPQPRVHWSDTTARIHDHPPGYQPDLDEGLSYYTPEARPVIAAAFAAAAQHGKRFQLELPLRTAKGRDTWVRTIGQGLREPGDPTGPVVRVLGAFKDIASERQLESLRLEHQAQLRRLYEKTPALLMTLDTAGRIGSVSDLLLERLGRSRPLRPGLNLHDWLDASSASSWQGHALPSLLASGRLEAFSCQLKGRGGRSPLALLSAVLEPAQGKRPAYVLAVLDDVTAETLGAVELRREQALRLQQQAQAVELKELLQERSEMLDVLAHEVRQPLNNASAALQAAAIDLSGEAGRALRDAQRVLVQVRAGVDNTLAAAALLAGSEAPVLDDIDLDLLVAIAIGDLGSEGLERVRVQRLSSTRTVLADFGLTRLALRNVLGNALNHTTGPVRLLLSDSDAPLALMLDVADSGSGIAPAMRERLFQRRVRGSVTSTRGSHGLGLYIARRAMALQGGQVLLLHTGPEGTQMRLQLPV